MIITKKRNKSLSRKHKSKVYRVSKTKSSNSKKNKYQFYIGGSKKASQVPVPVPDVIQPTPIYNTVDPPDDPVDVSSLYKKPVAKKSSMKDPAPVGTVYYQPETGPSDDIYENPGLIIGKALYPYKPVGPVEPVEPVYGNIESQPELPPPRLPPPRLPPPRLPPPRLPPPRKVSAGVTPKKESKGSNIVVNVLPAPLPDVTPPIPQPYFHPRVSKAKNTKGDSHF